jgi:LPS-assembly lipoprotein
MSLSLLLSLYLSGCGFHLRGKIEIPESMQRIYLTGDDQYSEFIIEAKRALDRNGVKVVKSSTDAPFTIDILNENARKRTVAVSNNFRDAAEYELRMEIEVEIRDSDGKRLMMPTVIYAERIYSNDENQIRAKES